MKHLAVFVGVAAIFTLFAATASAQPTPSPARTFAPAPSANLIPYARFTEGATGQRGLFTIWRKDGNVAIELRPNQFDADFVETGVPLNGLGTQASSIFPGSADLQLCRVVRFVKQDNRVAILFPTTRFLATPNSPEALSLQTATASTIAGIAKVLSIDEKTGDVVFDASPFLADITDLADALSTANGGGLNNPVTAYRLNSSDSYFGVSKAFPQNVVLSINQTFTTLHPAFVDAVPDGRNIQMRVQYNIAAIPQDDGYLPRLYDDRVGYAVNVHEDFSSENVFSRETPYILRWNIQASNPAEHLSPAKRPVVYYLSNTIPVRYRSTVRKALLRWNDAFRAIGISNAVIVKDQPAEPDFDPDDIRYNVIRWLTMPDASFAEAEPVYNPRTGEMIKSDVVIGSEIMRLTRQEYPIYVHPQGAAAPARTQGVKEDFARGAQAQFSFGLTALSIMNGGTGYYVSDKFTDDYLEWLVLHESGHDFGLRHNFIAPYAYTAAQLRSAAFTSRYGISSSVMASLPVNIWPSGRSRGTYFQTVLGPYDYYAIHWGYAPIPSAKTPQDEVRQLSRWASRWSDPRYAWSSDEDTDWSSGAAVDPRNQEFALTNDNIGWCQTQMRLTHDLIEKVDRRFPRVEGSYDDLRRAFGTLIGRQARCAQIVGNYIGGEYVSRSKRGDPRAALPLSPIPRSVQVRAFNVFESNVLSANAWNFSPYLLRQAVTQYRYDDWNSHLPPRHDIAVEQIAASVQYASILRMFEPVTLQRLDDMQFKYGAGKTMDITDLFTWMQSAVFDDIAHPQGGNIPLVRRNLQRNYASLLSVIAEHAWPGTPQDAQSLARYELKALHEQIQSSLKAHAFDLITKAHLTSLDDDVERGLHSQAVVPAGAL